MTTFDFTLVFALPAEASDPAAHLDALLAAGLAVAGVGQAGCIALAFAREAATAEQAVASAKADVERAIPGAALTEIGASPKAQAFPSADERAFVAAGADRRRAFVAEWPCLTADDIRRTTGAEPASSQHPAGGIIALPVGGEIVYPAFQFRDGRPLPGLARVLDVFGGRRDGWQMALWLTTGNGLLPEGVRPLDLLPDDADAVVAAARAAMAEPAA